MLHPQAQELRNTQMKITAIVLVLAALVGAAAFLRSARADSKAPEVGNAAPDFTLKPARFQR
jgi:hypothetical protein